MESSSSMCSKFCLSMESYKDGDAGSNKFA